MKIFIDAKDEIAEFEGCIDIPETKIRLFKGLFECYIEDDTFIIKCPDFVGIYDTVEIVEEILEINH